MEYEHLIGLTNTALHNANKSEKDVETVGKTVETNADALDYVVEEIIPEQSSKQEIMESTLEYILTEVIPSLMGDE